ncbi:synaptonemal complex central element protein 1-like [Rattus norvegicus]|uniref:synaptonemal complex central element protein 1-like n=1 Tax=Rattus norvegicus TaxID=10116 RepID=UPI0000DC0C0B|nr:synaptonemal complex central element protein 1-like [Rattus norvegicus]|eukprot:XP_006255738.1 PREDICTED: synaptonemal complex central element protein 1-like [Rattus norvegicus]
MAAELEPLKAEWLGAEKAEDTGGQTTSLNTTEDLLETVKKLQKEGSLEPQIEDLIHRINELQQAKKRSSEELGEAQALQEAMHQELDSLNEEKVHLEEVLCKKQDALLILQKHPQERESETTCLDAKQMEEKLEDLASQHKDLWEFHVLQQRLAQEISTMEHRKDQLLMERTLLQVRLKEVEQKLQEAREAQDSPENCGLKTELEEFGEQSQNIPEAQNDRGEAGQEEQHHVEPSDELPRTGTPC